MSHADLEARMKIEQEIAALQAQWHLVATNAGTYSDAEAVRAVGAADREYSERRVYETATGRRRYAGPTEDVAPGRMQYGVPSALRAARARIAELRALLRETRS